MFANVESQKAETSTCITAAFRTTGVLTDARDVFTETDFPSSFFYSQT
jgi:hypothetical protein